MSTKHLGKEFGKGLARYTNNQKRKKNMHTTHQPYFVNIYADRGLRTKWTVNCQYNFLGSYKKGFPCMFRNLSVSFLIIPGTPTITRITVILSCHMCFQFQFAKLFKFFGRNIAIAWCSDVGQRKKLYFGDF